MKKLNSLVLIGVVLVGLTACDSMSPDQRRVAGGLGGAAVGGIGAVAGSQIAGSSGNRY